jgi:hypothetical protein
MKSISEFLLGRKIPGLEADTQRRICADTASALLKKSLPASKFKLKEGELSISIGPLLKTEILLRRNEYEQLLLAQGIRITTLR